MSAPRRFDALCALCGHRWVTPQLGNCPACGGTARLIDGPPACPHTDLTGRQGDIARICRACGSLRVAQAAS